MLIVVAVDETVVWLEVLQLPGKMEPQEVAEGQAWLKTFASP